MKAGSVGEMVAISFTVAATASLVFWIFGLISVFYGFIAVLGFVVAPLLNHFLALR